MYVKAMGMPSRTRKVMSNITVIYLFYSAAPTLTKASTTVPPRLGFEEVSSGAGSAVLFRFEAMRFDLNQGRHSFSTRNPKNQA
jgi:hypothetical protein